MSSLVWKFGLVAATIGWLTLMGASYADASDKVKPGDAATVGAVNAQHEDYERDVDTVAMASQEKAIATLSNLLKKYTGTGQEPVLLAKLAELQQQNASIIFRIAHGSAHRGRKAVDLTRYNKSMKQSIASLTTLIAKYPNFAEISKAWFMRGRAFEELSDKKKAAADYLHLVKNHPDAEDLAAAYMSLAEFEIEANNHAKAIEYLSEVEKRPEDPRFPFALYKLAWAHYNLKNIPQALSFAERHVGYYNNALKGQDENAETSGVTSDKALRENTLGDIATFYLEGYEQNAGKYSLEDALGYFRKIESGPPLGKMITRFTKLLRSHGHDAGILAWKKQVLELESKRPESLEVVITAYDFLLNKRRYTQVVDAAHDMVELYKRHKGYEGFAHAQKQLLDTAEGLQAILVKNKGASEVQEYSGYLASVYDSFTKIVDEKDPRIPRVHYNLAETLFAIHDYDGATGHYRWVVDHGSWDGASGKDVADASVKAIGARYEVLREKGLIPKELTAVSLEKDQSDRKLEPILGEWYGWLEAHLKHETLNKKEAENFMFEANRALYAQGHLKDAIAKLERFSSKFPSSQYAIPSASLVIDTWIATRDWEKVHDVANDYLDVKEWKSTDFGKRLFAVAADASYKSVELKYKAHDFSGTVKAANKFLKRYASSARFAETLSLAGAAAVQTGDREAANAYFSRLIQEAPSSGSIGTALLSRAQLAEDRYEFADAASDYRVWLTLPADKRQGSGQEAAKPEQIRKKTLALTWLSGDARELKSALENKAVCTEALAAECEKYQVLQQLAAVGQLGATQGPTEEQTEKAFDKARKDSSDNRVLWAALALEGQKHLAWRDRMIAARVAAQGWDSIEDPLVKFSLISRLSVSLPRAFEANRKMMAEIAPLRAHERWITRRVEVIRELENAASKVMKLPWARIRAATLNEVAGLYLDLSKGLASLPAPKDLSSADLAAYEDVVRKLVMPFEEKGQEMRGKAFEIASRFSIEDDAFKAIAEPFFAENPSQARAIKVDALASGVKVAALDASLIDAFDSDEGWKKLKRKSDDPVNRIKAGWNAAFSAGQWHTVAFFMQEAQSKALVKVGVLEVMRAVSLAGAGARAEALAELEESRGKLDPDHKVAMTTVLLQHALQSCAKDRVKALVSEVAPEQVGRKQEALFAQASAYAGVVKREPATDAKASAAGSKKK